MNHLNKCVLVLLFSALAVSVSAQSVTPSGAFTWSYPIEVPPGTNGMQPNLSINYNSQAGNGMLGMGFSLSGMGSITRDTDYPINWNKDDHFLYNGQRLIWDAMGFYRTEAESFVRVYKNESGGRIGSWTVINQSGTRFEYGASTDSFIEGIGKNDRARVWALKRVTDVMGNYYEVEYEDLSEGSEPNGDYYPTKIVYTLNSNGNFDKYRSVYFSYESRSDSTETYSPSKIYSDSRLKWVSIFTNTNAQGNNGDLVRKYRFDYDYSESTLRSRITGIQEYGNDTSIPPDVISGNWRGAEGWIDNSPDVLPAISFTWSESDNSFELNFPSSNKLPNLFLTRLDQSNQPSSNGVQIIDLNRDGLDDLIQLYKANTTSVVNVYINNGSELVNDEPYTNSLRITDTFWQPFFTASGPNNSSRDMGTRFGDFNGDGLPDLIQAYHSVGMGDYSDAPVYRIFFNKGDRFEIDSTYSASLFSTGIIFTADTEGQAPRDAGTRVLDVNADGLDDLIQLYFPINGEYAGHTPRREVFLNTGNGFSNANAYSTSLANKAVFFSATDDLHRSRDMGTRIGDVNGDGYPDLVQIYLPGNGDYSNTPIHVVYLNDGPNGSGFIQRGDYFVPDTYFSGTDSQGRQIEFGTRLADINGDGKSDLIQLVKSFTGYYNYQRISRVFLSDGNNFVFSPSFSHSIRDQNVRPFFTGIYFPFTSKRDGYGIQEHTIETVTFSKSSNSTSDSISVSSFTINENPTSTSDTVNQVKSRLSPTTSPNYPYTITVNSPWSYNLGTQLVDINGDGLLDLVQKYLYAPTSTYLQNVYLNNGTEYVHDPLYSDSTGSGLFSIVDYAAGSSITTGTQFANLNGDGKPDLIQLLSTSCGTYNFQNQKWIWENGDLGTNDIITEIVLPSGGKITAEYSYPSLHEGTFGSFEYKAISVNENEYKNISNGGARPIVIKIVANNGLGLSSQSKYYYHNGRLRNGPQTDTASLGFEWIITEHSDGTFSKTTYSQDYGFRTQGYPLVSEGFDRNGDLLAKTQNIYGSRINLVEATNDYKDSYWIPLEETRSFFYNGLGGPDGSGITPIMSWTQYTYDTTPTSPFFGRVTSVLNHGEVTSFSPSEFDSQNDSTETFYTYYHDSISNIIKPATVSTWAVALEDFGFRTLASEQRFHYFDGFGRSIGDSYVSNGFGDYALLAAVEFRNGPYNTDAVIQHLGYDVYGNIVEAQDALGNSTTITYDSDYHTLPVSVTNALGQTATTTYDDYMRPISSTDPNGISFRQVYDEYGRVIEQYTPTETGEFLSSRFSYVDEAILDQYGQIITPTSVTSEIRDGDGANDFLISVSYFDGLGRAIQSKSERSATEWTTVDTYYDSAGRAYRSYAPYISNTSAFTYKPDVNFANGFAYSEVEFDEAGRPVRYHNTDGTFSQVVYKLNSILSINEKRQVSEVERSGRSSIENVYTGSYDTSYQLYESATSTAAWNGASIASTNDGTITTVHDMLGRKVSYNDPVKGEWFYSYDDNGNLLSQTDARGVTVNLTYDALNRPIFKDSNNVTYIYDGSDLPDDASRQAAHGYFRGRLTSVTYTGGSERYFYDLLGRITSITKSIQGESRTISYTYDRLNRIQTETLPTGEVLTYSYGQDGNLVSVISNDGTQYAHDIEYTAQGKLEQIMYGNGLVTSYNYFDTAGELDQGREFSFRMQGINVVNGMGQTIADTQYSYDELDNIVSKNFTDSFGGSYTETFAYDDLNRLIEATGVGLYDTKTYIYDSNNNILEKDHRTYIYDSHVTDINGPRLIPYAVSELQDDGGNTLMSYEYNENGDMISASGLTEITVTARRSGSSLSSPQLKIHTDDSGAQASFRIDDFNYDTYTWRGYWDGMSPIDIEFSNASSTSESLFIESIVVNGEYIPVTDGMVIHGQGSYSYDNFYSMTVQNPGLEELPNEGALRFAIDQISRPGAAPKNRTITYDAEGRLSTINDQGNFSTYQYDAAGARISKTENGITTLYFFASHEEVWDGSTKLETWTYIFAINGRFAQKIDDGTTSKLQYITTDHLGSAVRITDESGNIVHSTAYDPFGMVVYSYGNEEVNYTFTGQESDSTGLMNYIGRMYDPFLGRFIQADPFLDGLNRYAYVRNNPVKYVDPMGFSGGYPDGYGSNGPGTHFYNPPEDPPTEPPTGIGIGVEGTGSGLSGIGGEIGNLPDNPDPPEDPGQPMGHSESRERRRRNHEKPKTTVIEVQSPAAIDYRNARAAAAQADDSSADGLYVPEPWTPEQIQNFRLASFDLFNFRVLRAALSLLDRPYVKPEDATPSNPRFQCDDFVELVLKLAFARLPPFWTSADTLVKDHIQNMSEVLLRYPRPGWNIVLMQNTNSNITGHAALLFIGLDGSYIYFQNGGTGPLYVTVWYDYDPYSPNSKERTGSARYNDFYYYPISPFNDVIRRPRD
jgi:RHS repeat-associated protein